VASTSFSVGQICIRVRGLKSFKMSIGERMFNSIAVKPNSKKWLAVDLFSGCGGLTQGLKLAGFSVVGAVEIDQYAVSTYLANHPEVIVKQADIETIEPRSLMKELGVKEGEIDLLCGCPPCQGFSKIRTKNGAKKKRDFRNGLSSEVLRFAQALRPQAVMMENVPDLVNHRSFKALCSGLRHIGYHVHFEITDVQLIGVPQRRKRLIMLAGLGVDIALAPQAESKLTVRSVIGALPPAGESGDPLHDFPESRSDKVMQMIRDIPADGGSRTDLPRERQLACHKDRDGFRDIYGRMAWDKVAPTITGGCFNPSKGRFLHPEQDRAITLREAALLQSFPSDYKFTLSSGKVAAALMIGNALPPEFIRRQAVQIRSVLAEKQQLAQSFA
jgi:DNA (cytosine-5)-methyltransferase 1